MKKKMNVCSALVGLDILVGAMWIGIGIIGMFDVKILERIRLILLAGSLVVISMVVARYRSAKSDEMFEYNCMKAKAIAAQAMHYVYCALMILSALVVSLLMKANVDLNWARAISSGFFVLMGIQSIITGIALWYLEAE